MRGASSCCDVDDSTSCLAFLAFRIAYLELHDYQAAQAIKDWFDNQ